MIEIISAKTTWRKATNKKNELEKIERERQEKASYEELKKAVNKIQVKIQETAERGLFNIAVFFEEEISISRKEEKDTWFYLEKGNITKIIEMFSIAGYDIKWIDDHKYDTYGYFSIKWEMNENE